MFAWGVLQPRAGADFNGPTAEINPPARTSPGARVGFRPCVRSRGGMICASMGRPESLVAFGPGKVILLGEHGVVYGHPALAGPLSWGVTARGSPARKPTLDVPETLPRPEQRILRSAFRAGAKASGSPGIRVSLDSELPPSMGLGSSAAVSVAIARLLLKARNGVQLRPNEVARVAWEMESVFHGTPSGVDHTVSVEDALIHFRRRPGSAQPTVRRVEGPRPPQVPVALLGD